MPESASSASSTVADLAEREAELAQREQPVQALHVGRRVQAVPAVRALGRHEQPEPVVVVQGADGHARGLRQLADPVLLVAHQHAANGTT